MFQIDPSWFQIDPSWFQIDAWAIAIIAIGIAAFLAIAIIWGIRAHRHQATTGREELVGKTAVVKETLEPEGTIFLKGERWAAISEKGQVKPGEEVIITKVEGLKLYVTKKELKEVNK